MNIFIFRGVRVGCVLPFKAMHLHETFDSTFRLTVYLCVGGACRVCAQGVLTMLVHLRLCECAGKCDVCTFANGVRSVRFGANHAPGREPGGGGESEESDFRESCRRCWLVANRATLPPKWPPPPPEMWPVRVNGPKRRNQRSRLFFIHPLAWKYWSRD